MDKFQAMKSTVFAEQESVVDYNGNLDTSQESIAPQQNLFDTDEIRYKGKPIRGRRYLAFTVIMIILLSAYIMLTRPTEKEIIDELKYEQEHGRFKKDIIDKIENNDSIKIPVDTKDQKSDKPADKPDVKPAADDKGSKTTDPSSDGKAETTGDDKSGNTKPADDKVPKTDDSTKSENSDSTVPKNPDDASKVPAQSGASDDKSNEQTGGETTDSTTDPASSSNTKAADDGAASADFINKPADDASTVKPADDGSTVKTTDGAAVDHNAQADASVFDSLPQPGADSGATDDKSTEKQPSSLL